MAEPGNTIVRRARAADLPAVSRLAAALVRQHHAWDGQRFLLVEPVEDGYQWFFSREIKRKGALILVAEEPVPPAAAEPEGKTLAADRGGTARIVGYAYATLEGRDWNDLLDACGKLNDLFVAPEARRRGVARALVTEAFAWFREGNAPRVVLLSAWRNPDAHAFFEALGFRRTMLEMTAELP
jgi:GNAT superfamily N-acetyltransferase